MPRTEYTTIGRDELMEAKAELRGIIRRIERITEVIPAGKRKRMLAVKSLNQGIERLKSFADYNERAFVGNGKV